MLKSKMKWDFTYSSDSANRQELINELLEQRGLHTEEERNRFLHPALADLHDPFLINGMRKAVNRVKEAIHYGEPILIFGDYDADGVSSTALMMECLRSLGAECDFYIPNRFTEGYGPNENAFRWASAQGYTLIITVDNGIAAVEEAKVAKELGIDLIITDHHEVQNELPEAFAILHPKTSLQYPFQELAGVGVAFKFAHALLEEKPVHLLDLVAIGTVADLVPLEDENRILVSFGLEAITKTRRPGLRQLKNLNSIDGDVDEEAVGFMIGPRMNAVGRLQDASPAVDLLLTGDEEEAQELAGFVQELNKERQKIVQEIADEAEALLGEDVKDEVIVVAREGWNAGVLGIVASKLVRKFDRPAIVLTIDKEKGQAKGSARSIDAYDMFENCMEHRELFLHFGGHSQAAGMTLAEDNIISLREELSRLAREKLSPEDYGQSLPVTMSLDLSEVSLQQIEFVNQLRPFGMANPKPYFHVRSKAKELRLIGSKKNHMKVTLEQNGSRLDAIAFGQGDAYHSIAPQSPIDMVGQLSINEWNGTRKPQMMVEDIAVKEWQLFDWRGTKHLQKSLPSFQKDEAACVTFGLQTEGPGELPVIGFNDSRVKDYSTLILLDLPERLEDLHVLLGEVSPERIYAVYSLRDDAFMQTLPSREHFKYFYGMLKKKKTFDLEKDSALLARHKGWKVDSIKFICNVFFDLGFVTIKDGQLFMNTQPEQKSLTESRTFQTRQEQMEVEKVLYYSTYKELKDWMETRLQITGAEVKEEIGYGL
ncbi:single-stranded-DNA-specific exonuclease RecJ [Salimicrobium humidisoli]|uniref:Single-stranded-DNA-specific exonuclease RecJ n=1 Tax=Salimicrobium humidisoli TaxID=2029857 RepID=A0ABX4HUM4_9BACI|nr:single-stranded-DNA-specific exonuclease RecJ [Salimicrobium humidisoli]PBB06798.1 single-stranded-DNA-specific exonuclease RecJ [Salimicrobium humidisoli]